MKMIECVIKPHRLDNVQRALHSVGIQGATAIEVKGYGRQKGRTARYRGGEMDIGFVPKVLLKVVVKDSDVDRVVSEMEKAAKTGSIGDGKVFVSPVEQVVRIRTGEKGEAAV